MQHSSLHLFLTKGSNMPTATSSHSLKSFTSQNFKYKYLVTPLFIFLYKLRIQIICFCLELVQSLERQCSMSNIFIGRLVFFRNNYKNKRLTYLVINLPLKQYTF